MLSIIVGMVYFMLDILRTDLWSKCSSKEEPLWQRTTNEIKWMGFNEFTINIGLEKWNEFQSLQIWLGILGKLQFWESFTGKIWIQVNLDLPEVDPYSINKGFLQEHVWLFCLAAQKNGRNNAVIALPRWL